MSVELTNTNITSNTSIKSPIAASHIDASDDETDYFATDCDSTDYYDDESVSDISIQDDDAKLSDQSTGGTVNDAKLSDQPTGGTVNDAKPSSQAIDDDKTAEPPNQSTGGTVNDAKPSSQAIDDDKTAEPTKDAELSFSQSTDDESVSDISTQDDDDKTATSTKDADPFSQSVDTTNNAAVTSDHAKLVISTRTVGVPNYWVYAGISAFKSYLLPYDAVTLIDEPISNTYLLPMVRKSLRDITRWYSTYAPTNKMVNSIAKATKNIFTPGFVCDSIKNAVTHRVKRYEVFTNSMDSISHTSVYAFISNYIAGQLVYEGIIRIHTRLYHVRKHINSDVDDIIINMMNESILEYYDIKHYAVNATLLKLGRMGILPKYKLIIANISKLHKIPRILIDSDNTMMD